MKRRGIIDVARDKTVLGLLILPPEHRIVATMVDEEADPDVERWLVQGDRMPDYNPENPEQVRINVALSFAPDGEVTATGQMFPPRPEDVGSKWTIGVWPDLGSFRAALV